MKTRRGFFQTGLLCILGLGFHFSPALAGQMLIDFESPYYGYSEDLGVLFYGTAFVSDTTGSSLIKNAPSFPDILILSGGPTITFNVTNGCTGVNLWYINGNATAGALTAYSGLNGSGSALASVSLPQTPAPAYQVWVQKFISHSSAQSFVVSGVDGYLAVDDIHITGGFKPRVYFSPNITALGASTATLSASVNPEGAATSVSFEYAANASLTAPTTTVPQNIGTGTADVAVAQPITGLARGTTYYFHVLATNSSGATTNPVPGTYVYFTTLQTVATTLPAGPVASSSAVLNGSVIPNELSTGVFFQYSTNSSLTGASNTPAQNIGNGTNEVAVNAAISGLNSGNYYFRVVATNSAGTFNGSIGSFSLGSGYTSSNGPAATFTDISGTGTQVIAGGGIDDTASGSIGIGFNFKFFGASKTNLYVNPNGLITFGSPTTAFANFNLSVTSVGLDVIAVLWDDWKTSGGVYAQTIGSPGQRVCILQWNVVTLTGNDAATFQAQLYEDTGDIVLIYPDTVTDSTAYTSGAGATVGIQKIGAPANGGYLMWSYNSAVIASGTTVRFSTLVPRISQPPQNQTVALASNAAFSVAVSGASPFAYRWIFNGAGVSGATNNSLTVSNAGFANVGNYQVIITNSYGSVTSSVAQLYIAGSASTYAWTNFAGLPGAANTTDGTGSGARFNRPLGVAADSSDNIFVADRNNFTIRKITPAGVVTTFAGTAGVSGSAEGVPGVGKFFAPYGLRVDASGNVFEADNQNSLIRKISPVGVIANLAGSAGSVGSADGTNTTARFNQPVDVALDFSGNVFVADAANNTIRKITPANVVTTPYGLAGVSGTNDNAGNAARFNNPGGVAFDAQTNLFVTDELNHTIRKITPAGLVSTLCGKPGVAGGVDGVGSAATLNDPGGIWVDSLGNVFITEGSNHTVRKITPGGVVTTIGGLALTSGSTDGVGANARFNLPDSITMDSAGNLYVADSGNHRISKGTPVYMPVVTTPLANQTVVLSNSATFFAGISSGSPAAYQWFLNGTAISGATNSSLTVSNAGFANVGNYQVIITNSYGSVTSSVVRLDILHSITTTSIGSGDDTASGLALQSDGKIVAAGYSDGSTLDIGLVRYNADGSLDTGFGSGGKVTTDINGNSNAGNGVALQNDGKILVAGFVTGATSDFALVRYDTNGVPDAGFGAGGNGRVVTSIGSGNDYGNGVAVQTDGKIVVAGGAGSGSGNNFALVRYTTNGIPDATFGTGGKVTNSISSGNDAGGSVALQTDGKIVVAGYATVGSTLDFALARFNSNGTLDTNFGGGGNVTTAIGGSDENASGVAIQTDGKIVVVGQSYNGSNYDFAVVRYTTNGVPDTSFNGNGKVITPLGSGISEAFGVALQGDGKILVTGFSYNGTNRDVALVRYTTNGLLDATFYDGGKVTTAIGSGDDTAYGVAVQPNGQIVAAGYSFNGSNNDFAVVRYDGYLGSPTVVTQPQSATVLAGGGASFTVGANGTLPLAYQWLFNGVNIAGATNSLLTLTNVDCPNRGNYQVMITNVYGSATSSIASLGISNRAPVAIPGGPYTNAAGGSLSLNGLGSADPDAGCGDSIASYQWDLNNDGISDVTGATPTVSASTLASFGLSTVGIYTIRLKVADTFGTNGTQTTTLTVIALPAITSQPQGRTNYVGTAASFSVTATNPLPLTYQWRRNGTNLTDSGYISGAATATLSITSVGLNDAAGYSVVVSNGYGAVTSAVATLTVYTLTTANPDSLTTLKNVLLTFTPAQLLTNDVAGSGNSANLNLVLVSVSPASGGGIVLLTGPGVHAAWTNRFCSESGCGVAYAVAVDSAGHVIVTGITPTNLVNQFITLSYSNNGVALWTNRYTGRASFAPSPGGVADRPPTLAVNSNNDVFVAGASYLNSNLGLSPADYTTIHYSSSGGVSSAVTYDGAYDGDDFINDMVLDVNGNVIVAGRSYVSDPSSADFAVIKYSANLAPQWTNYFDGGISGDDEALAMVVDAAGNVVVSGGSQTLSDEDCVTIKYSSAGAPLWTNRIVSGFNPLLPVRLAADTNGDIILAFTDANALPDEDFLVLKYSAAGLPLWTNRFDGAAHRDDFLAGMKMDGSGNVVVTGTSESNITGTTNVDVVTIKYSSAGVPMWTNRFRAPGNGGTFVEAEALTLDGNGNAFVAGSLTNAGVVLAYSAAGAGIWTNYLDGLPTSLCSDQSSNVIVAGSASGGGYLVVKYSNVTAPPADSSLSYIPPANFIGADTFTYVIQDSLGMMATGTVSVVVAPPAIGYNQLSSWPMGGNAFLFFYQGLPGTNYALDRTYNLAPPAAWVPLVTNPAVNSGLLLFTNTADPATNNFWRIRSVP